MPTSTTYPQQYEQQQQQPEPKQSLQILQFIRPQQQKFKFKQWQQQHHQWLVVSVVMLTLFTVAIEGITEELSPGCLSEEALETSHKNVRKARLMHTRKSSRLNTNKDLMTHLLLSSDPVLSANRTIIKNKSKFNIEDISQYIQNDELRADRKTQIAYSDSDLSSDDCFY